MIVNKKNEFKFLYELNKNRKREINFNNKISVIGLGYVGLTLCLSLSNFRFTKIYGIDTNKKLINDLKKSKIAFYEHGLDSLLKNSNKKNKIEFKTDYRNIVSDVYIVCVNTPPMKNLQPNLKYILNVILELKKILKKGDLIILRSTVPIGSTKKIILPLLRKNIKLRIGIDYYVSFAPERLVEGNALEEQKNLPQIVGAINNESLKVTQSFFDLLNVNVIKVDSIEEAEIIKLANNSYRDHIFSFSNSLSFICDKYNINTNNLIKKANDGYPRDNIPLASPGVGGICLSKDPFFFDKINDNKIFKKINIGKNARAINSQGAKFLYRYLNQFTSFFYNNNNKTKIFIIGLSFKGFPETSDIRYSTSLEFIDMLKKNHFEYSAYDKNYGIIKKYNKLKINFANLSEGFHRSNAVFIVNNHPSYSNFDINSYLSNKKKPFLFFDAWGLYDQKFIESFQNVYYGTLGYITNFKDANKG